MSDEETIVDLEPETLDEESLFLEDDLEIEEGPEEEGDLDFKASPDAE